MTLLDVLRLCGCADCRQEHEAAIAEIERLHAALEIVVNYGAAVGTAQWDVCRRALEELA